MNLLRHPVGPLARTAGSGHHREIAGAAQVLGTPRWAPHSARAVCFGGGQSGQFAPWRGLFGRQRTDDPTCLGPLWWLSQSPVFASQRAMGPLSSNQLRQQETGLVARPFRKKKKAQHVVVARAQKMFCGQDTHMLRSVSMNRTIQNLLKATPSMFMLKRAPKRCLSLIEWMLRTSWKAFPRENVWWMLVCSHPSLFKDWKRDAEYPVHHQYIQSVYNEACSRLQWIIHLSTPFRYLRCTMD